jgi:NAD-dependent SIR2 family protein deacetylase
MLMPDETNIPRIGADDFTRRFSLRARKLMWFLGAGTSASAGIPTAGDMIWEFKQQLFVSQRRVSPQMVADLSSPVIRDQIQAHIDSSERLPPLSSPDEYAALFEAAYPAESDRQAFLDSKMSGAKPSYGHLALATLMQAQLARLVWTTNFDPLVADACAKIYNATGPLTTVALDAPDLAAQLISAERWPLEVKLHGDFRSRRLKNTSDELRHQDVCLKNVLIDSCRRFGLVVAGYSGRDDSIMDAFEAALESSGSFPGGLFWLHRGDTPPLPRVGQLLAHAVQSEVEAALVLVENFDEVLRDLVRLMPGIDSTRLATFAAERRRWSAAPLPGGGSGWPVVRLNALPVVQVPSVCRRVVCQVGGYAEVRDAVEKASVHILFARTRAGVLAYGTDADVRNAFEAYDITDFGLHTIDTKRLRYESGERGLLCDALVHALGRQRGLDANRKRQLVPSNEQDEVWKPLRRLVDGLSGSVKGYPELLWREGIGIRLDWADDRLWLLVEPRAVFQGITDSNKGAAADFARERTVKRYNRQLNELINFWAHLLADGGRDLRALSIGDGVDAVFRLSSNTGFSRRARA